ncbi:MAG: BON domain-containing protein [Alphaproteobacteria bacterium]|nr:BON domain-containing protein [Alphaproteobacteria bacterium]
MPQDQRNWRRSSRDWDDERDYGRGRDDWRAESRGYQSRGYSEERGSSYGGGREDHDNRQDRDYQGTLRAGDYGRYEEEDGLDYPPRFRSGRGSRQYDEQDFGGSARYGGYEISRGSSGGGYGGYGSREYGRGYGGRSREYSGYGGGSGCGGSGNRGAGYQGGGFGTYTEDYERRYGSGGASPGYSGRGYSGERDYVSRDYGNRERGWWDKATDEVSSWFGDEEAERRRRMDEHRGRGPKNYSRSDDRIREDVNDRLTDDPLVDASEIEVSVQGQEVTLSGTVSSRNEKRLAEECAESVSGVKHVQNNLRVKNRWLGSGNVSGTPGTFGSGSTTTM